MTKYINYKLIKIINNYQLRNIRNLVKFTSDFLYNILITNIDNNKKSDSAKF